MNTNGRRLYKRAAGWLTGVMVLSSACGTTAMANGVMLVDAASVADVHAEADETSPVLVKLSGTQAVVLGHDEDWTKVQVGDITGWVESEHLTNGSDTTEDIVPESPEKTEQTGSTEEKIEQTEQTEEKERNSEPVQNEAVQAVMAAAKDTQRINEQQKAIETQKAEEAAKAAEEQKAIQKAAEEAAKKAAAQAQAVAEEAARKAAAEAQAAAEEAARKAAAEAQAAAQQAAAKAAAEAQAAAQQAAAKAAAEAQAAAVQAAQQAVIAQAGVSPQDVDLLAALIQCEAGGEPYVGQVAVGNVVMNRVESAGHPASIPDVIYAAGQFSPVRNGSLSRTLSTGRVSASCRQAAVEAIAGSSPVGDKLYFRRANGRGGQIIGNHVFY